MRESFSWIGIGILTAMLGLAGCPEDDDDAAGDDDAGDDDTADDDDDGGDDDTEGDDDTGDDDTSFDPCTPFDLGGDVVTIDGTILTPSVIHASGEVSFSRSSGLILCVGDDCSATDGYADGVLLCSDGIVTPGIIDPHNHLQYNSAPPWQIPPDLRFLDRYDWQGNPAYWDFGEAMDIRNDVPCEVQKWAEARLLVAGSTSVSGTWSYGHECIAGWVRDLDADDSFHGLTGYRLDYDSQQIGYMDSGEAQDILDDLASGWIEGFTPHVAEGWGDGVRWEFDHLADIGLLDPGVSVIHGTDQSTDQLITMLEHDMSLIWSPRSNLALYQRTTPTNIAAQLGTRVALGTDWTPSGSLNQLDEMSCAHRYDDAQGGDVFTPRQILEMTTTNAARALGATGLIGALEPGAHADIAVYAGDRSQPYRSMMDMDGASVRATLVGGALQFGDEEFVEPLEPAYCEGLDVCGVPKTICIKTEATSNDGYDMTLVDIQAVLEAELAQEMASDGVSPGDDLAYIYELCPLFECGAPSTRFSCEAHGGSEPGDADGDHVLDGEDICPDAFDPEQWDLDRDGSGDACDVCPMDPQDACGPFSPGDTDGDGTPDASDLCPHVVDSGVDSDGDGVGDLCDLCPQESNPGNAGCTFAVASLSDPAAPDHPFSGTAVNVHGVVVTAIRPNKGFFVSDPAVEPFGGIYVYIDAAPAVQIGDVVDLDDGEYQEYYHLGEIAYPTVTVVGQQAVPGPYAVDPADVCTTGPLAEAYEGQLITVGPVTVTSSNPDAPNDYEEFEVSGGLRVDDWLYDDLVHGPAVGTSYSSLTGILTFVYGHHKLAPRDAADVVE